MPSADADSPIDMFARDHFLSRYNGAMTRLLPEEFFKQGVDGAKTLGKKAAKKARRGV